MTLFLNRKDIETCLRDDRDTLLSAVIDNVKAGYLAMAAGQVDQHTRIYLRPRDVDLRRPKGMFSMSALNAEAKLMGSRIIALGGEGPGTGGDGMLILFDQDTLRCLSIMNDQGPLHRYRTGAPTALGARLLARPNSRRIGVVGSSGMAKGGLAMVSHEFPDVEEIRVFSRNAENRDSFAREMSKTLGKEVVAVDAVEKSVEGADIVVVATDADRPVIPDGAISPGTHIGTMARNELEMQTYKRSKVVLNSLKAQREWEPPWHEPIPEEWLHGETMQVLTGERERRSSEEETTVYVGGAALAMWDVAAAAAFYESALRLGIGTEISLDG